jgi:hypothetical protein
MNPAGAALYLDFDNVFSGLLQLDPKVALQFAEDPGRWVARLKEGLLADRPRRWLVLRCYMNPAGAVRDPRSANATSRIEFSRFRQAFTREGFEVVDCPRLTETKNGADIRIVIDVMESLASSTRFDEYVIASGDSDMTPLLVRLRAADRRTTAIAATEAARGFAVVADRFIDREGLAGLVKLRQDATPVSGAEIPESAPSERFRSFVTRRYRTSPTPLLLSALGQELRKDLGAEAIESTKWFGFGTCSKAVANLQLPGAQVAGSYLWDSRRHQAPTLRTIPPAGPRGA